MATTLRDIRQIVGGLGFCSDITVTTAISGSDSTKIVDDKLTASDDAYNYGWIVITSGSASGDRRRIADWAQSTHTLTPDRNFTAAVSSGDGYEIHRLFSPDEKDDAIAQAVREARRWLRHVEDETLVIADSTYRYRVDNLAVPVDRALGIDAIYSKESTEEEWTAVNPNTWWLADDDGVLYLEFDPTYLPDEGEYLRLQYCVRPAVLTADASTLSPDDPDLVNYIAAKATGLLFQSKADRGEEKQTAHWQMRADAMERRAELFLGARGHIRPNPTPRVAGW